MKALPRNSRRLVVISSVALVVAATSLGVGIALGRGAAPLQSPSSPIDQINFAVPRRISTLPLINERGQETDLGDFHGRYVILADFMTSCQEECPITTGALLQVRERLAAAKHLSDVSIIEVSVDPTRDVPSRLRAYAKSFGIPFTMLTGSSTNVAKLWKWFGVYYKRVKEDTPPDINWQNGRPYTYDVVHTDDVFILDNTGRERAIVQSNADVNGQLPSALASLLDADGRQDLTHPGFGSWTPTELLEALAAIDR